MYSYFFTGPVNHSHFLSLSLAGVHAEPSSFGPPTISPSEPPTQLASMSYFHLHSMAVLLPALPPGPGFCRVYFTGLIRWVPHWLPGCLRLVPTIYIKSLIISSQPSSDLGIYLSGGFSWSNGGTARSTAQAACLLQSHRLGSQGS